MPHFSNQSSQAYFAALLDEIAEPEAFLAPRFLLKRAAERYPEKKALTCSGQSITFGELYAKACSVSQLLKEAYRITSTTPIALLWENSLEYYAAYFGIWQTGAVIVPLNTFLTHRELQSIINDCEPACIVASPFWIEKLRGIEEISTLFDVSAAFKIDSSLVTNSAIPLAGADELAALLYTSGTTGTPKGVMLSNRAIMTNVAQIVSVADLVTPNDKLYAVLPLFHSFAQNTCIWSSFFLFVEVIVVPRIDRKAILEGLAYQPTVMVGVPSLYGLLCLMKTAPIDSIRYFISGGDALPTKIKMAFEIIYQRKLCNGYGLTEASPFVAANLDDDRSGDGSIGYLAPGMQAQLVGEDGLSVGHGAVGMLAIKGDNLMDGYYKSPEATAAVLRDGWLHTGDLARFDDKNRFVIVGREKDLIISKGFNIYPPEIENILMNHALVMRAAVIGIPDEFGEMVIAFVQLKAHSDTVAAELKEMCVRALAAYKIPKHFFVIEEVPVNSLMKINKKALKQIYYERYAHNLKP